ncbi:helix-turn-helix transcriptional regulator [Pseudofrankia sp. DC12]|uniref:ArsR/SmtB family transcription factor n=1 Tax=Pseudofrankia sp. DC12 TaxID=683315 RepID=UPI000695F09F|nr:helix-turn-helix transcriptional regulator [Pseudofrankia sp. DC12]
MRTGDPGWRPRSSPGLEITVADAWALLDGWPRTGVRTSGLAGHFEVTWSAVSQHIGVLKAAGFLTERRVGTSRLYRADEEGLGPLRAVVEAEWEQRLNQIKALAEAEHARSEHREDP